MGGIDHLATSILKTAERQSVMHIQGVALFRLCTVADLKVFNVGSRSRHGERRKGEGDGGECERMQEGATGELGTKR